MSFSGRIKSIFSKTWSVIKKSCTFLDSRPVLMCVLIGFTLNFITESLHRHSPIDGLVHMVTRPLPFLFNCLVIITTLVLCTLAKKRYFWISLVSALWFAMGLINGVVLLMRVTPFEWADLSFVKISLIQIYLNNFEIILIITAILLFLAFLIFFFVKGPKLKVNYIKSGISSAVCVFLLIVSLLIFRSTGILTSNHVRNLANAYLDYGFNYCFMCSVFDIGIDKPSQYEQADIDKIMAKLDNASASNQDLIDAKNNREQSGENPNIIFLQLETFFDVKHLKKYDFSENPIPNFTELQKEYSTGYLTVPSIGAGTANTEFEVIAGMSLEYFGMGEYPYKTVLRKMPVESVCYNLAANGYTNHVIHNNNATFYDRNEVFTNLGFNTFTSIEYMQNVQFTINGWAKDNVLEGCIIDALDSTPGSDCVYTISVQSHGKYPSDYTDEMKIKVSGIEDEKLRKEYEYYINQLYEVDLFVGNLLKTLEKRDEKTIVVLYGDHLPSFSITEEDIENGDLFQTEYVIWDNIGLKREYKDLCAYQLSATVLEKAGFDTGILTKLHQNFSSSDEYEKWFELIMYDMLYGEKYLYDGDANYPHKTVDLQMGVKEITISNVIIRGKITITGENFTKHSTVFCNDNKLDTIFVDSNTLVIDENIQLKPGDRIAVGQVDKSNLYLSFSKAYLIGGTTDNLVVEPDKDNIIYETKGLSITTLILLIVASAALVCIIMITLMHFVVKKDKKQQDKS